MQTNTDQGITAIMIAFAFAETPSPFASRCCWRGSGRASTSRNRNYNSNVGEHMRYTFHGHSLCRESPSNRKAVRMSACPRSNHHACPRRYISVCVPMPGNLSKRHVAVYRYARQVQNAITQTRSHGATSRNQMARNINAQSANSLSIAPYYCFCSHLSTSARVNWAHVQVNFGGRSCQMS